MREKLPKKKIQSKIEESLYLAVGELHITLLSKKTRLIIAKAAKRISKQLKQQLADQSKKEKKEARKLLKKAKAKEVKTKKIKTNAA